MNVTETISEGLRREYAIQIPAGELDAKLDAKLKDLSPRLNMKGFRPGKVPVSFLKKAYGKSMMGEVVQEAVDDARRSTLEEKSLRVAAEPRIELKGEIEAVVEKGADLEFTLSVDLMPEFTPADPAGLTVERLVAEVAEADIDEAVKRFADQQKSFEPREDGEAARSGDVVVIDFEGRIDGTAFEGGKGEKFRLELGSGQFIPGFEDQLMGVKTGDARVVAVQFPDDYPSETLKGKSAEFDVTVHGVEAPKETVVDDEFAKTLGLESLADLRARIGEQIRSDFARASRMHLKRRILDALDTAHDFPLPPGMVDAEFDGIWRQVTEELARENKTFADEGKSENELRAEYRTIAERRVRLGLVLAEIGRLNAIQVSEEEVSRAIIQQARNFPGQEQKVFEFYRSNMQAQASLRAPIFEDKVVDFVAELATVNDRSVDRETLFLDPDEAAEKLGAA